LTGERGPAERCGALVHHVDGFADVEPLNGDQVSLRTLIDGIPELAWTARADGFVDFYNRRWYEYSGTTPVQARGWGWKSVHHPDMLGAVVERWQRSLTTGEPFEMEFPLRGADGVFRWFLTRIVPVRDLDGAIVRWFGTSTNVDESHKLRETLAGAVEREKRAHERVEALREEALRAVRAREEVLAIVSHDLRNPLSTVLTGAEMITKLADDGPVGVRTKKATKTIVKAVSRMTRMIGDLLDLATLEAGRPLAVELETQDAVAVLREAADTFEPVANARQLRLTTDFPDAILLPCDAQRVQQALSNLIGNAVKFTREGGSIHVSARLADGELVVTVRDTGIGIPAEHLPHIFKAYWQADVQRKRGAGLGLSIVKAIVETHGGRVWAESAPGDGASFHFTLPIA
jgi:PAS domain S-box-containing protein